MIAYVTLSQTREHILLQSKYDTLGSEPRKTLAFHVLHHREKTGPMRTGGKAWRSRSYKARSPAPCGVAMPGSVLSLKQSHCPALTRVASETKRWM